MRKRFLVLPIVGLGPIVHGQKPSRLDDLIVGELRIDTPRLARWNSLEEA